MPASGAVDVSKPGFANSECRFDKNAPADRRGHCLQVSEDETLVHPRSEEGFDVTEAVVDACRAAATGLMRG